MKKGWVRVLAVLVLVLVLAGILVLVNRAGLPFLQEKKIDGVGIAEQTILFIESLEDSNGDYAIYMTCDDTKEPFENQFALKSWAMLAYASLYDATGKEEYKGKIQGLEVELINLANEGTYSAALNAQLHNSFQMLKGKGILKHENDFANMIAFLGLSQISSNPQDTQSVQGAAMISSAMSVIALDEIYLSPLSSELFNVGIEVNESSMDSDLATKAFNFMWAADHYSKSQNKEQCWAQLAKYNLAESNENFKQEILDYFDHDLKTTVMAENKVYSPVELQPCAEVLIGLYEEEGNEEYLSKYTELTRYMLDTSYKDCGTKKAFTSVYNGDKRAYLADNAYEIYLLTKAEKV
ncbi:hypothetical protein JXC34_01900 [Candidatus Woesearchaeota archaeon]|nr:hypothetical protein [Candidatus Woesearchaeota archaeon]